MQYSIWFYIDIIIKMLLSCVLGGIIGLQRESIHRPAGFRTHILVCAASALVMITSVFIFDKYSGLANIDPARLGANVLAGIGFIGAGTIIKEGFNVKGITTAASIFAVACVGLAVGIGFYSGAVITTILIYLTLVSLKFVEEYYYKKRHYRIISIEARNVEGQIEKVMNIMGNMNTAVRHSDFVKSEDNMHVFIQLSIKAGQGIDSPRIAEELNKLDGIERVHVE